MTREEFLKILEEAFNAGQEITYHEWHMEEFHGTSCDCEPLEFMDFNEWIKWKKY